MWSSKGLRLASLIPQAGALNITGTPDRHRRFRDILTGLILGLLAQRAEPFAAACAATWLLGTASELAARESGIVSQLPRDVLAALPKAINSLHAAVGEYFPEEEI